MTAVPKNWTPKAGEEVEFKAGDQWVLTKVVDSQTPDDVRAMVGQQVELIPIEMAAGGVRNVLKSQLRPAGTSDRHNKLKSVGVRIHRSPPGHNRSQSSIVISKIGVVAGDSRIVSRERGDSLDSDDDGLELDEEYYDDQLPTQNSRRSFVRPPSSLRGLDSKRSSVSSATSNISLSRQSSLSIASACSVASNGSNASAAAIVSTEHGTVDIMSSMHIVSLDNSSGADKARKSPRQKKSFPKTIRRMKNAFSRKKRASSPVANPLQQQRAPAPSPRAARHSVSGLPAASPRSPHYLSPAPNNFYQIAYSSNFRNPRNQHHHLRSRSLNLQPPSKRSSSSHGAARRHRRSSLKNAQGLPGGRPGSALASGSARYSSGGGLRSPSTHSLRQNMRSGAISPRMADSDFGRRGSLSLSHSRNSSYVPAFDLTAPGGVGVGVERRGSGNSDVSLSFSRSSRISYSSVASALSRLSQLPDFDIPGTPVSDYSRASSPNSEPAYVGHQTQSAPGSMRRPEKRKPPLEQMFDGFLDFLKDTTTNEERYHIINDLHAMTLPDTDLRSASGVMAPGGNGVPMSPRGAVGGGIDASRKLTLRELVSVLFGAWLAKAVGTESIKDIITLLPLIARIVGVNVSQMPPHVLAIWTQLCESIKVDLEQRCADSPDLSQAVSFLLSSHSLKVGSERSLPADALQEIHDFDDGRRFFKKFRRNEGVEGEHYRVKRSVFHPFDSDCGPAINVKVQKVFNSNARPVLLRFYHAHDEVSAPFILKIGDDLRKDVVILEIFKLFNHIWKTKKVCVNEKVVRAHTYGVAPITRDCGCMEYVRHCRPITDIASMGITDITDELIASAAGAFVAVFVLGIRDRHSDNILVQKKDFIFHIDFSHIFNKSVRGVDTGAFAITKDLERVLGPRWDEFVDQCVVAFRTLRSYSTAICEYSALTMGELTTSERVIKHISTALRVAVSEEQACAEIRKLIVNASSNLQTRLKNFVHGVAQGRHRGTSTGDADKEKNGGSAKPKLERSDSYSSDEFELLKSRSKSFG